MTSIARLANLDMPNNSLGLIGLLKVLDLFFRELYIHRSNDFFEVLKASRANNRGSYVFLGQAPSNGDLSHTNSLLFRHFLHSIYDIRSPSSVVVPVYKPIS